jgi:hypothetical protein
MSDRQRRRAFLFAAVFTLAVCAVVWLVERPRAEDGMAPEPTTHHGPLVLGAEPSAPAAGKAANVRTARRFTMAFLQYQVGRLSPAVRRAIQATTTPSFARTLLSEPPRLPHGVQPPPLPRVQSIEPTAGSQAGAVAVVVELLAPTGEMRAITESLSRSHQEWRISGLE